MGEMDSKLAETSAKLYSHISSQHWNGSALIGPDPGVRFNSRIGRFVKSYWPGRVWGDDMTYMQAQSYWIMSNWHLSDVNGPYRDVAIEATEFIVEAQREDGAWDYPNPEWRGRIATVEGCFASLALLKSYEYEKRDRYLDAALRWNALLETKVGYRPRGGVNYFAHGGLDSDIGGVPNNTTLVLWFMAELSRATGDSGFLARSEQLISWLRNVQLETGELPYKITGTGEVQPHFLCINYNAFQLLDLIHYYELTADREVWPLIKHLADFLPSGLTSKGTAKYECERNTPIVLYYAVALARALSEATRMGLGSFHAKANVAYDWVVHQQLPDGNFKFYSSRNYKVLSDRRSYPRYLAIVLYHLLMERKSRTDHVGLM